MPITSAGDWRLTEISVLHVSFFCGERAGSKSCLM